MFCAIWSWSRIMNVAIVITRMGAAVATIFPSEVPPRTRVASAATPADIALATRKIGIAAALALERLNGVTGWRLSLKRVHRVRQRGSSGTAPPLQSPAQARRVRYVPAETLIRSV